MMTVHPKSLRALQQLLGHNISSHQFQKKDPTINPSYTFKSHIKPISVNQLYSGLKGGARFISKPGKAFKEEMALEIMLHSSTHGTIKEPIHSSACKITLSDKIKGDIDNYCKALIDCFVSAKIISDDRHINYLCVERVPLGFSFIIQFYEKPQLNIQN